MPPRSRFSRRAPRRGPRVTGPSCNRSDRFPSGPEPVNESPRRQRLYISSVPTAARESCRPRGRQQLPPSPHASAASRGGWLGRQRLFLVFGSSLISCPPRTPPWSSPVDRPARCVGRVPLDEAIGGRAPVTHLTRLSAPRTSVCVGGHEATAPRRVASKLTRGRDLRGRATGDLAAAAASPSPANRTGDQGRTPEPTGRSHVRSRSRSVRSRSGRPTHGHSKAPRGQQFPVRLHA